MAPPRLNRAVNAEVGADRRLAINETSSQDSGRHKALIDQVNENGYAVLHNAFSQSEINEAKDEILRLSGQQQADQKSRAGASEGGRGRNTFEGINTERIYALANKSRVFDKFALHPDVLALNDHFLERGYLLNSFQSINIKPGEKPQTLHFDDGYITVPRPHTPFGAVRQSLLLSQPAYSCPRATHTSWQAIMVAVDPYTSTNGATVIVPRSHTWGADRLPDRSEAVPVVMPAGSMFYFLSTLWHGGGANTSSQDRVALTVQYCQPWIRQLENQMMAVEWDKLDDMPPRLVDMLGYKVGAPFIGHVNGHSPRVAVSHMLRKRQREGRDGMIKTDPRL
ncbi:hypothetical protein S7711_07075 [Stachybotrys chartarum IBT 7711]|uniref:Phytanoyl-CoA dioxygenase family protein n=1 Tax=Stachybotrys chartarum (strain CBS 109288 / IBT 7711) TaxID=1280523 RepID=A0A084AP71_STACB|nr:hypothetical protein S7711_07075 [Stachybotrys chartarum IBT 7711]KFA52040.1 hypothetical protein S40293_02907 [Stachybotrys chartarum IBT 40293]